MQNTLATLTKEELIQRVAKLEFENNELRRLIHGAKSERFKSSESDPQQLKLDLGEAMEEAKKEVEKEKITYEREKSSRKEKPVRTEISADIPREEILIEPETVTEDMKKVGEEITEELEFVPGTLKVNRYIRPKYARSKEDGSTEFIIARLPSRPIDKGIPGPGLLSKIIIDKYVDHLPIYRQVQRFKREGILLADSTLYDWQARTCHLMEPLYELLQAKITSENYVQADETPIPVLDKDKKDATHRGYLWVYHAPQMKAVFFDYRKSRGKAGPLHILLNFKGWLQTDGYRAYDEFETKSGIHLVGCLAHARRKFEHALPYDKANAEKMLIWMQQLYAVERQAREAGLNHEQRKALREEKSRPITNEIGYWLVENHKTFLPKSPMGQAVAYLLSRFNYILRYLNEGILEIDNNLIENTIRPVALGRKNYLFAGSHEGAKRAAMIYSFMATCKLNSIEPFTWLRDTLSRLPDHPINKLEELLPFKKES